jgi:hypothetical protein
VGHPVHDRARRAPGADAGDRLFHLSELHGPSILDTVGIALLVLGWAVLDLATWRRRRVLSAGRPVRSVVAAVAVAAAAVVAWSVLGDHGSWWIVGAFVLAAIQVAAALMVTTAERVAS